MREDTKKPSTKRIRSHPVPSSVVRDKIADVEWIPTPTSPSAHLLANWNHLTQLPPPGRRYDDVETNGDSSEAIKDGVVTLCAAIQRTEIVETLGMRMAPKCFENDVHESGSLP